MVFQQFHLFPHLTALENVMSGPLALRQGERALLAAPVDGSEDIRGRNDRASVERQARTCSTRSVSPTRPTSTRSGCPAASSSGSRSPARSPCSPR